MSAFPRSSSSIRDLAIDATGSLVRSPCRTCERVQTVSQDGTVKVAILPYALAPQLIFVRQATEHLSERASIGVVSNGEVCKSGDGGNEIPRLVLQLANQDLFTRLRAAALQGKRALARVVAGILRDKTASTTCRFRSMPTEREAAVVALELLTVNFRQPLQ